MEFWRLMNKGTEQEQKQRKEHVIELLQHGIEFKQVAKALLVTTQDATEANNNKEKKKS